MVAQQLGDLEKVRASARECIEISYRDHMSFWLAGGKIMEGWCLWSEGNVPRGINEMREGLANWRMTGAQIYLCFFESLLLTALVAEGLVDAAFETYEDLKAHIERTNERWWEPEVERLHGELLARRIWRQRVDHKRSRARSSACPGPRATGTRTQMSNEPVQAFPQQYSEDSTTGVCCAVC